MMRQLVVTNMPVVVGMARANNGRRNRLWLRLSHHLWADVSYQLLMPHSEQKLRLQLQGN